mmetsp:Transcript_19323/g.22466  ORF Transcript_19323/g.22466 Transcript_19323/m.22466 type:complete len:226 (+) Transcript_19323:1756-2433(+)
MVLPLFRFLSHFQHLSRHSVSLYLIATVGWLRMVRLFLPEIVVLSVVVIAVVAVITVITVIVVSSFIEVPLLLPVVLSERAGLSLASSAEDNRVDVDRFFFLLTSADVKILESKHVNHADLPNFLEAIQDRLQLRRQVVVRIFFAFGLRDVVLNFIFNFWFFWVGLSNRSLVDFLLNFHFRCWLRFRLSYRLCYFLLLFNSHFDRRDWLRLLLDRIAFWLGGLSQ